MTTLELWQGSLRGVDFGAGTSANFGEAGISGLGFTARSSDQPRGTFDGDVAGEDRLDAKTLSVALESDPTNLDALKVAWRPSVSDLELELWLPGWDDQRSAFGRARGLDVDAHALKSGRIPCLGTFRMLDPRFYGPEVEDDDVDGTVTTESPGTVTSDRVLLTVTGDGGTPTVVSTTDDGNDVVFRVPLGAGEVRVIDLRFRVSLEDADVRDDEISPSSLWPVIHPGENVFVVDGAASLTVAHRPAYL